MIHYPVTFTGESTAAPGLSTEWSTAASGFVIPCAVPKEFEGPGAHLSPEDFFLLALQNCFVASFKVFAHYSKLKYAALEAKAELVVDKTPEGQPVMKELRLKIELGGVENLRQAKLIVQKSLDTGFILQSVKTTIVPEVIINDERQT